MTRNTIKRVIKAYGKAIREIRAQAGNPDDYGDKEIVELVQDILNNPRQHRGETW